MFTANSLFTTAERSNYQVTEKLLVNAAHKGGDAATNALFAFWAKKKEAPKLASNARRQV